MREEIEQVNVVSFFTKEKEVYLQKYIYMLVLMVLSYMHVLSVSVLALLLSISSCAAFITVFVGASLALTGKLVFQFK